MCRSRKLITAWVFALAATAPLAAQATFEIPTGAPNSEVFRPQKLPEETKEEKPLELVYDGKPLKLPLLCRPEDFLRAGVVCGEQTPCDMLLELVDITNVNDRVLLIGNIHTTAATITSVLLRSDDAGKTWKEPFERVGASGLEMIQILDDQQHGWIGGQRTTQDHASTPFLVVTSDGGANWVRRPIWGGDEERHGSVTEIYFDGPQHGFVIIDRLTNDGDSYELYESMNGGLSWTIRQISSEMPTIRRRIVVNEPEKPWRLHENRSVAAYEIEHLVDGEWAKAAAFALDLGACSSMEAQVPFQVGREP